MVSRVESFTFDIPYQQPVAKVICMEVFESDTYRMYSAGWRLVVQSNFDNFNNRRRVVFKHDDYKLVLTGWMDKSDFMERHSPALIRLNGVSAEDKVTIDGEIRPGMFMEASLNPGDYYEANHSHMKGQEMQLSDMYKRTGIHDLFLPLNPTAEDIVIVKDDIGSILEKLRESQVPSQIEILKNRKDKTVQRANILAFAA